MPVMKISLIRKKCKRAFRLLRIFYAQRQIRRGFFGVRLVRITLPQRTLNEHELTHLSDHIAYLLYIGCQVQYMPERLEMPLDCIACQSYLSGGILKHRTMLKLKAEYVATNFLFSQQLSHRIPLGSLSFALRELRLGEELNKS